MNRSDALDLIAGLLHDQRERTALTRCAALDLDPEQMLADLSPIALLVDLEAVVDRVFEADGDAYRLADWAGLDQITAVAEQHRHESTPVPTPGDLPCPTWCDKPIGHPFDTYESGESTHYRRDHVHRFGDRGAGAALEQIERSVDPMSGVTDLGIDPAATTIRVQFGPGQVGYLTAPGARRMAAQLIAAADMHDDQLEGPGNRESG